MNSLRVGDGDGGLAKVEALADWRAAAVFSPMEQAALELADRMSGTGPGVDDGLWSRLREHFDEPQLVELAAAIAFENFRSRLNPALGVEAQGFCLRPAGANGM